MEQQHFLDLASYSAWANLRLLADAAELPDGLFGKAIGVYFESLQGTLNHLLQADKAWTHLLQGGAVSSLTLPAAPPDLARYAIARRQQDARFIDWIGTLDRAWFERPFEFVSGLGTWKGKTYVGTNGSALTHVFNHQTHHRGQAHTALTLLGVSEPRALDIVVKGFLSE